jgi:hypothetical protein
MFSRTNPYSSVHPVKRPTTNVLSELESLPQRPKQLRAVPIFYFEIKLAAAAIWNKIPPSQVKSGTRFGLFKIKGDFWLIAPTKGKFVSFERQYS